MSGMEKIPVYVGNEDAAMTEELEDLYKRIRHGLSKVLPAVRYTVFNISAKAVKHQPWIEKTTACLLIACTDGLDDSAWSKMQTYFNQSGKIIFICQNRLLASLTNCESSKKQADILRMALGHNHSAGMGKDFENFLKKSLKTLNKHGIVNETFRSKDLAGGVSYSVILTKTKDTPLLLYIENSAHQAAAMFSDATLAQLLVLDCKLLRDSMLRVGVSVQPETRNLHFLFADTFRNIVLNNCSGFWLVAFEGRARNLDNELIRSFKNLAPRMEGLLTFGVCNVDDIEKMNSFKPPRDLGVTSFFGPGFSLTYTDELTETKLRNFVQAQLSSNCSAILASTVMQLAEKRAEKNDVVHQRIDDSLNKFVKVSLFIVIPVIVLALYKYK